MRASSLGYLFGQGVTGLWKNRMMTLASVGVLTACLLIVGFAVLLTENINQIVGFVESQNEVVTFMYRREEQDLFVDRAEDVQAKNNATALQIQQDLAQSGKTEAEFRLEMIAMGMTEDDLKTLFGEQSIAEYLPIEQESAQQGYPVVYWNQLISQIDEALNGIENVEDVRFVSREQALASQKKSFGELSYLLEGYSGEENPLSHSFVVKITDLSELDQTKQALQDIHGIKLVNASNEVASTLVNMRRIVNIVGWSIVLALSTVSLIIIVNTIRASIFTRRKEVNIMKYVGATNAFIRFPFIVEGLFLGLLASIVAYLIIWGGYSVFMQSFLEQSTAWIRQAFSQVIAFESIALKLAVFFVASGVGLGVLGSAVSIRNHIKV